MITLTVNGTDYKLEFRHVTKMGKRAQLHRGSVKAVTTCVITTENWIAIDKSLCTDEDNFSRREGRWRALRKLLDHCGALKEIRLQLWAAYFAREDGHGPGRIDLQLLAAGDQLLLPVVVRARTPKLSEAEVEARKAAGAAKREKRQMARGAS